MHSFISFSLLGIIFLTRVEFLGPQVSEHVLHGDQSPFLHNSMTIENVKLNEMIRSLLSDFLSPLVILIFDMNTNPEQPRNLWLYQIPK